MAESIEIARYKLSTPAGSKDVVARLSVSDALYFALEIPPDGADKMKPGAHPKNVNISIDEARLLVEMTKPGGSK